MQSLLLAYKAFTMTKPANSKDKPSPADTPTHRPNDNGHKSIVTGADSGQYGVTPHNESKAMQHEKEEQPVNPIKNPPAEKGMKKGKVQPWKRVAVLFAMTIPVNVVKLKKEWMP